MSSTSLHNYSDTDRPHRLLSLPELPAPSQPENIASEALSTDYFGEIPGEEIAAEAYALYVARGCEDGHDVEDWLAAEEMIRARTDAGRRSSGSR